MSKKPSQCSFPIRQISEEHTTYCSIHFKACSMEISYLMSAMLIINIYKIPPELSKVHKLWRMVNFFLSLLHQLLSIWKESYILCWRLCFEPIFLHIKFDKAKLHFPDIVDCFPYKYKKRSVLIWRQKREKLCWAKVLNRCILHHSNPFQRQGKMMLLT